MLYRGALQNVPDTPAQKNTFTSSSEPDTVWRTEWMNGDRAQRDQSRETTIDTQEWRKRTRTPVLLFSLLFYSVLAGRCDLDNSRLANQASAKSEEMPSSRPISTRYFNREPDHLLSAKREFFPDSNGIGV